MFKKIAIIMAIAASLIMMSCSDDKSTDPAVKDSEAFTSSMTGTVDDMMAAPGAVAMETSSGAMEFLPFSLPIKGVNSAFDKIERSGISEKFTMPRVKYPESSRTAKQDDHFVFADHLGTYTCTSITTYTDPDTGETYVTNSEWTAVYGGDNITIIIPADVALDDKKFELVLYGFTDELITWYDAEQYYYYDYYPTFINMDAFVNDVNVFALDYEGDWEYMAIMDDVMPLNLNVQFGMAPFDMNLTFLLEGAVIDLDMTIDKNDVQALAVSALVTFVDTTLEEVKQLSLTYTLGNYSVEIFVSENCIAYMDSEDGTMQGAVDMINAGTEVYVKIKEGTTIIGSLKAKLVTVTDDEGTYQTIVYYILFTDGSQMTMEEFLAMFAGYAEIISK